MLIEVSTVTSCFLTKVSLDRRVLTDDSSMHAAADDEMPLGLLFCSCMLHMALTVVNQESSCACKPLQAIGLLMAWATACINMLQEFEYARTSVQRPAVVSLSHSTSQSASAQLLRWRIPIQ